LNLRRKRMAHRRKREAAMNRKHRRNAEACRWESKAVAAWVGSVWWIKVADGVGSRSPYRESEEGELCRGDIGFGWMLVNGFWK
jgi:hypothetical protein